MPLTELIMGILDPGENRIIDGFIDREWRKVRGFNGGQRMTLMNMRRYVMEVYESCRDIPSAKR